MGLEAEDGTVAGNPVDALAGMPEDAHADEVALPPAGFVWIVATSWDIIATKSCIALALESLSLVLGAVAMGASATRTFSSNGL